VYFVPPVNIPKNSTTAVAFTSQGLKLARDAQKSLGRPVGAAQDDKFANTCFIPVSAQAARFQLAHEIGHILTNTNDSKQDNTILFPTSGGISRDNTVPATKRLSTGAQDSDPSMLPHDHFTEVAFDKATMAFTAIKADRIEHIWGLLPSEWVKSHS
jgi:hypothetical protein